VDCCNEIKLCRCEFFENNQFVGNKFLPSVSVALSTTLDIWFDHEDEEGTGALLVVSFGLLSPVPSDTTH